MLGDARLLAQKILDSDACMTKRFLRNLSNKEYDFSTHWSGTDSAPSTCACVYTVCACVCVCACACACVCVCAHANCRESLFAIANSGVRIILDNTFTELNMLADVNVRASWKFAVDSDPHCRRFMSEVWPDAIIANKCEECIGYEYVHDTATGLFLTLVSSPNHLRCH